MATYIAIPKLGMTMTEATLVEWKVREGEWVEEHQAVMEIETEKIKCDVETTAPGFVHILVAKGNKVPVGRVVGLLAESKEELEALQKEPPKEIYTTVVEAAEAPAVEATPPAALRAEEGKRIRISPVARRMAEEHMIDITTITGTGPDGRIVREDIERAIETKKAPPVEVYEGRRVKATIPLAGMRKAIAEHMHRSLSLAAQLTSMGEIDMTEVIKLRNDLLEVEEVIGARITYTDILVLVLAKALKENPIINSSLIGDQINVWEDINIGVAVALEGEGGGLIVPVVRNADRKSLVEISQAVKALVDKAREGKLMPDDVTGNTFTLTNLGAFGGGWGFGTPIINQPDSAILGTGAITERAVVREGQIVIRPIMTYSFTFDHRVIDGAPAGIFMARVTQLLEKPGLLLL